MSEVGQNDIHLHNKTVIHRLGQALYDIDPGQLENRLEDVFSEDCAIHLCFPFEDLTGPRELYENVYRRLLHAVPDLERREFILMGGCEEGTSGQGSPNWVGCCGHYVGVFEKPWLDIPPTLHPLAMRYHEFFRLEGARIVEMQALWDIPQVMMQARAWPMAPSLGVEWLAPAPTGECGIRLCAPEEQHSEASLKLVGDMLEGLSKFSEAGSEAMNLPAYWHPKMSWYGPAGIGTNRRISGFRNWHQIPFLKAMPDRGTNHKAPRHFFADGPFVGFTAWPGMRATVSADGWLGIAAADQPITLRSLDFWRCEKGSIRENWVLVDLLDVFQQLGVDVFSRMRELTVARQVKRPSI